MTVGECARKDYFQVLLSVMLNKPQRQAIAQDAAVCAVQEGTRKTVAVADLADSTANQQI